VDTTKIDGAGMVPVGKVDTGRRFWLVVDATKLDDTGIVPVGQVDTGRGWRVVDTVKLDGIGMVPVGKVDTGRRFGRWVVHVGCHRCPVVGSE